MRDTLLRFAEVGLFLARWSPKILDEWKTNLLERRPDLAASVEAQIAAMERAFPESCVDGADSLIDGLDLPDPDDRHVLATAIRTGAEHIVTENLRDFPGARLEQFGITAVSADDFLASTFQLYPAEALASMRTMRREYARPAMTPGDFIFDLQARGLPTLASMLKENIDVL
jgi:hypothetical protein